MMPGGELVAMQEGSEKIRLHTPVHADRIALNFEQNICHMTPQEQVQFRILRTIEQNPEITQRELARQLGVSNGKAHYLIAALIEKGLLKMENFRRSDNKIAKVAYLLTPEGVNNRLQLTRDYLARKEAEYIALQQELSALRAEIPGIDSQMETGANP